MSKQTAGRRSRKPEAGVVRLREYRGFPLVEALDARTSISVALAAQMTTLLAQSEFTQSELGDCLRKHSQDPPILILKRIDNRFPLGDAHRVLKIFLKSKRIPSGGIGLASAVLLSESEIDTVSVMTSRQSRIINTPDAAPSKREFPETDGALTIEALRRNMRAAYELAKENSGITLSEIGRRMGLNPSRTRQGVYQLMNDTDNPSIFSLDSFARAVGLSLIELLQIRDSAIVQKEK